MKSLRHPAHPRQLPTAIDGVLALGAELADDDPYVLLSVAARELLKAYAVLGEEHGACHGRPGASWARDVEVARRIGSSISTVRRARAELAAGDHPHVGVEYVPPFHRLPTGEASLHGTNVVTVLALMGSATDNQKSAPRAATSSSRRIASPDRATATTPPGIAEASMSTLHEQFSPSQAGALEAAFAALRTDVAKHAQDTIYTPLYERVVAVENEVRELRTELGARLDKVERLLEQLVAKGGGGSSAGGGGGSSEGLEIRQAGADAARVHIMPQARVAPAHSPLSSVALPRAA